ncbi:MAG: TlpA family protein disulfide reductase [Chloroflexota bacterium]
MSGSPAGIASGPAVPAVIRDALVQAGRAQRDGGPAAAVAVLSAAMEQVRTTPFGVAFMARVQLALALTDACLAAGDRERARRLLLDESGYTEQIVQLLRLNGTPEQQRTASAGRMQVRDRAVQVERLGQPAPELDIADWVLGELASLTDLKGQVILLEFWATWCRPCLEMFPRLRELHARYRADGLEILALTRHAPPPAGTDSTLSRQQQLDLVRTVIAGRGLDIRVGIAPDGRLQQQYGANGVPTLVLIDRQGRVREIGSGGDDPALDAAIEACLAEPRP